MVDISSYTKDRRGSSLEDFYGLDKANSIKLKQSLAKKGRTWEDIFGKENAERRRIKSKSKVPWNKGKKDYLSPISRLRMKLAHLGQKKTKISRDRLSNSLKGRICSKETRDKISKAHKGKTLRDITKSRLGLVAINQKKTVDPSTEKKIRALLDELKIEYKKHYFIDNIIHKYQCDIFLPSFKTIIECDGDYFHNYPLGKPIDKIRTDELIEAGYRVIRLWENEIKDITKEELLIILKGGNRLVWQI